MAFELSKCWMQKSMQMRSFKVCTQRTIEMQFVKHLSFLRASENTPVRMTVTNTFLLMYLSHILYNLQVQQHIRQIIINSK